MELFLFYLIGLTTVSFFTIFLIDHQNPEDDKQSENLSNHLANTLPTDNRKDGQIIKIGSNRHAKSNYTSPQPSTTLHRELIPQRQRIIEK